MKDKNAEYLMIKIDDYLTIKQQEDIEKLERELAQAQKRLIDAEQAIREFVAIAEDMSNGKDVGNRLIVAWDVADKILEDNEREQP